MHNLWLRSLALMAVPVLFAPATLAPAAEATATAEVDVLFPLDIKGAQAMRERLRLDLAAAKAAIRGAPIEADARQGLEARAEALAAQVEALPGELPADFRAIMPFSDLQAAIFALNAPILRARGFAALCAWTQCRWDPLFPTQAPKAPPALPSLSVALMRGEQRSEALNLTNATDRPMAVHLDVRGLPGGRSPVWVSVREVLFTDTYIHYPIAAALPEAKRTPKGYQITIPAGMTRQVWLTFHPTDQRPGTHRGQIVAAAAGAEPLRVPLRVRLYPIDFPKESSIAVGGWDYTHDDVSAFDAGRLDQATFIRALRDYGVNTPWSGGIPIHGVRFDAEGRLLQPPDFGVWDKWVAKWRGARFYAHFLGIGDRFPDDGEPMGTPRFRRMVGEWITAVVERAKGQGIRPSQLLLLLVDEPLKPEQDRIVPPWAEAIKAAQPEVVVWEDPCHEDPGTVDPRVYEACDVLSPSAARFVGSPQSYRDVFVAQQRAGRELWFYSCVNGKHLDPITYHRGQFWLAIRYGAKGSCYWAFGDEGGAGSSFKAYTSPGHMFSPLFLDPQMGIIDGKHMQAIREGAEDYEYFALLRRRVAEMEARGAGGKRLQAAKRLLVEGPQRVCQGIQLDRIEWRTPKDRTVMDQVRVEVLDALASLMPPSPSSSARQR